MTHSGPLPLNRATAEAHGLVGPPAPARSVHIGLGAFFRAHQAWYTAQAADAQQWGITAFTGRSAAQADLLKPQDGLYTLVERGPQSDSCTVISAVVDVAPISDAARLTHAIAAPQTAYLTTTVTEAGYALARSGGLDTSAPEVVADLTTLRRVLSSPATLFGNGPQLHTVLGRITLGLAARQAAGGGPLTVVPCDNVPNNGEQIRQALMQFAVEANPELARWYADNLSVVSTSVDRITPRPEPELAAQVTTQTGWIDAAPVVTEPFNDWVLSGEFLAGRPAWETAGALFVPDISSYESRKLWLLNGAHSLLAYFGQLLGHCEVSAAISDSQCLSAVEGWWRTAVGQLPRSTETSQYRTALLERFSNPRNVHLLAQIAMDGSEKLAVRTVPVVRAELAAGRLGEFGALTLASWITVLRRGLPATDANQARLETALASGDPTTALLAVLAPDLAENRNFTALITDLVDQLHREPRLALDHLLSSSSGISLQRN